MSTFADAGAAVPERRAVGEHSRARLRELVVGRFEQSVEVPSRFFDAHADGVSRACLEMARRFRRGGRLLVFGEGPQATDAHHVAVEFAHPVIVGKRALPALALTNDVSSLTGLGRWGSGDEAFARTLCVLGRADDVALGISSAAPSPAVLHALRVARQLDMLTLALSGEGTVPGPSATGADFDFVVPSPDPLVVQEVHETLYHVLWELVHLFFEHRVAG